MAVIRNQISGHVCTLDNANVSYNLINFSVNNSVETVQRVGISSIMWTGDWNIKQGADTLFLSNTNTAGFWDLTTQGIVLRGSNSSANIVANTTGSTSTLVLTVTKYANNNVGI
jgi:hypothetical protein